MRASTSARARSFAFAALLFAARSLLADRFDDALKTAQTNVASPEGRAYADALAARFDEKKLRDALTGCAESLPAEDNPPFTVLMQMTADGRPSQILLRPPAPVAVCLRWILRETTFPKPPGPGYWVSVDLDSRRSPGAPVIPTPGVATASVPPTSTPAAPPRAAASETVPVTPTRVPTPQLSPAPTTPSATSALPPDVIDFGADGVPIHVRGNPDLAGLRRRLKETKAKFLGPILAQSDGIAPDDPRLEPYWSLAQELRIPAVVPLGLEPRGTNQDTERYRVSLGDPLKLESALIRHPNLTLVVSGAAWPMGDAMTALMWKYPRVYVDTAMISWAVRRDEFYGYIQRLIGANLLDQILFASGGTTPKQVTRAVDAIQSADCLKPEQKEAILRGNAAKLLGASTR